MFWGVAVFLIGADIVTKYLAVINLPPRVPHEVLGLDWLRLTLIYNRGAAFGLHLGNDAVTRIVFIVLTVVALAILWRLYAETAHGSRFRVMSIALVTAGAIGNLIDRVRSASGVVDFLDLGIGASRWPTFNIADMAVSTGAVMLAMVLWRLEKPSPESASSNGSEIVPASDRGNSEPAA
jgi:signal peptidase II